MRDEMSVREWQKQFQAGAFESSDYATQCKAGWFDWSCRERALAGRLKKLSRVVMGITDPFILDNYCVCFKNNSPESGTLYDDARFELLSGEPDGNCFRIALNSPHEKQKWVLYTERGGFTEPEFACGNAREMAHYINCTLGPELAQGITSLPSRRQQQKHPKRKEAAQ